MADENLSRDEVEELLRSMEAGDKKPSEKGEGASDKEAAEPKGGANKKSSPAKEKDTKAGASDLESMAEAMLAASKPQGPRQRVIAYDFKRPERVGKEQMRGLQSLHEGFARNFGASLSAILRTIVEAKLISVDQLTYSEFVYSLEIPTCFNLLRPEPLEGNWILDFSPSILYPIIDRMLGGAATTDSAMKRPLSEIELRLTNRISNCFLRELASAWVNTVELSLEVERVESNPQLVQIVPPNEVVILVSFELLMGKCRGMVNLCIPFNTIERIGNKLSNSSWIGYASSRSNEETQSRIAGQISGSQMEVVVNLAKSTISTNDLIHLQVGDIVTTEKDISLPLDVEVAGVGKFAAKAGAFKGKKAIEIVDHLEKQEDWPTPNTEEPS